MINLFEDQEEFVTQLRHSLRAGNKAVLGVASPAFGKTVVAGHIIAAALSKGGSAWFLVHRKNLLRQTSKSFWSAQIEHGLITGGRMRTVSAVQVGTIGTVFSRIEKLTAPKILFVDEAHLARGNMFETVIKWALSKGSIVIGLTGTPERLDGKALGDIFEDMVEAKSTQWLIEQGRLSDYEMYTTPVQPDLSHVKKSGGDYNREQLAEVMDSRKIVGDTVSHWKKLAPGKITVCYCVNVKHSKHTAEYFNQNGVPAVHVDAETTEAELRDACEGLASGKYLVLCNCELVIEGFDLSAQVGRDITIECCILLRPTQSKARYLQMVFRALRRKDYPAIILDHAGCAQRHGLPDDLQEWSLEGKEKGKKKSAAADEVKIKQCGNCYAVFRPGPQACPHCGAPVAGQQRELEVVDGQLEKVDKLAIRKEQKKEQGKARTLEDLVALGLRRGMAKADSWAAITFAARAGRKPSSAEYDQARAIRKKLEAAQ